MAGAEGRRQSAEVELVLGRLAQGSLRPADCDLTANDALHERLRRGFFFSSRRRHTRFDCDWSSDVCSSDLDYPGDQWHAALARLVTACRAYGLRAIDGPYGDFKDPEGYRAAARRAAALGYE